jgi:hypothetical protein
MAMNGEVRRDVQAGPWQPCEAPVQRWAEYLRSTGFYDRVEIESMRDRDSLLRSNRF